MFSFHKPKIYRSNLGCCICKAKSSSSRFTDSKKYENEFEHCFRIEEKRSGEICNACVLLVKRWKKLSPENRLTKHWHHVVDARAGPGTKLTSGRRFAGPSTTSNSSSGDYSRKQSGSRSSGDVLPLSSNQTNNQAGESNRDQTSSSNTGSSGQGKRSSSNGAKSRSTNETNTFTFSGSSGEYTSRRSYMTQEPMSSSSSLSKPQSALNSSAFESVIKRFRQRQQQQQIEAQRRLMNRRQKQQIQPVPALERPLGPTAASRKQLPPQIMDLNKDPHQLAAKEQVGSVETSTDSPVKRVKRSSESIGSFCVDGLRVSTLLDPALWRKEKICCGTIFRGKYNEVAIFPKLIKPCAHKLADLRRKQPVEESVAEEKQPEVCSLSPLPRATKSGSISSCDSNTSGTGSMEMAFDQAQRQKSNKEQPVKSPVKVSAETKQRPSSMRATRRQQQQQQQQQQQKQKKEAKRGNIDTDSTSSSSAFSSSSNQATTVNQEAFSPGGSSSCTNSNETSSSSTSARLLLSMDDEACGGFEVDEEEMEEMEMVEDEDEIMGEEDEAEETDASSSVESLTSGAVEGKKSGVVGAMG